MLVTDQAQRIVRLSRQRRIWLPAACAVMLAAIAGLLTAAGPDLYVAESQVLAHPTPGPANDVNYSLRAERTIAQLMTARPLLSRVGDQLQPPASADQLRAEITVTPVSNSEIITVDVSDRDPRRAADIANAVVTTYMDSQTTIQPPAPITLVESAIAPAAPVARPLRRNLLAGLILGVLIGLGLDFVLGYGLSARRDRRSGDAISAGATEAQRTR
jgi:polysaccharide biosynthesis transport protein